MQIYMQQPMIQTRPGHFNAVRQHKRALKRPTGNAAMQIDPINDVLGLTSPDHQLAILDGYRQIIVTKPGHGQSDPVRIFRRRLDVERRIAFGCGFRRPLYQPFQLFKSQQEGMGAKAQLGHFDVLYTATFRYGPILAPHNGKYGAALRPLQATPAQETQLFRQILRNCCANHYILFSIVKRTQKPAMNAPSELNFEDMLRIRLDVLRREHRDLDEAIRALEMNTRPDQLTLRRFKKQKLALKDQIARLEDQLIPDILA